MELAVGALRANPEIALFLAIASGVMLGRVKIGTFHLGSVAGALLMGLLIGQVGVQVPHELKAVFFALFIYAVGFKSGPEFFGSLNRGTLRRRAHQPSIGRPHHSSGEEGACRLRAHGVLLDGYHSPRSAVTALARNSAASRRCDQPDGTCNKR